MGVTSLQPYKRHMVGVVGQAALHPQHRLVVVALVLRELAEMRPVQRLARRARMAALLVVLVRQARHKPISVAAVVAALPLRAAQARRARLQSTEAVAVARGAGKQLPQPMRQAAQADSLARQVWMLRQGAQMRALVHLLAELPHLVFLVLVALAGVQMQQQHSQAALEVSPAVVLVAVAHQLQAAQQARVALVAQALWW